MAAEGTDSWHRALDLLQIRRRKGKSFWKGKQLVLRKQLAFRNGGQTDDIGVLQFQ